MKIHNPNITGSLVLSGSAGTSVNFTSADKGVSGSFSGSFEGSLKNVKTIDATTESTIESSIDTLANLTSIQGNTVTLGGNLVTQNNNVTINAAGAARTLTLNESLTVGDGHDGTLTYSAASKTLTIEDTTNLNQDLTSDASPTFAAGTITGDLSVGGTLTAQEVHTEFESASILFTSGSTRFGDDTTDTHRVTGSMDISGSLNIPHGDLIIQDNIDVEGDIDVNGTTNLDNVDIDGTTNMVSGVTIGAGSAHASADDLIVGGTSSGNSHGITIATHNDDSGRLLFSDNSNLLEGQVIYDHSTNKMTLGTAATTAVTIDSSQKVGIGLSNPASTFHVSSSAAANANGVAQIHQAGGTNFPTLLVKQNVQGGNANDDQGLVVRVKGTSGGTGNSFHVYNRDDSNTALVVKGSGATSLGSSTLINRVGQPLAVTTGGGSDRGGIAINSFLADTNGPLVDFNRSRNNTIGSHTSVNSGDGLGAFIFRGSDGDEYVDSAAIVAEVDGSPGNNDMPGRLQFYTTPDGTNSLVERMRITNAGRVGINTTSPDALLHVSGSQGSGNVALFQRKNGADNTSYMVSIENDDTTSNQGAGLNVRAGNDSGDVTFNAVTRDGSYGMRILGDGRVGVGLSDPEATLQVNPGVSDATIAAIDVGYGIEFNGQTDGHVGLAVIDGSAGRGKNRGFIGFRGVAAGSMGHSNIVFGTCPSTSADAVEIMRINTAGTVLMGTGATITDGGRLQVNGGGAGGAYVATFDNSADADDANGIQIRAGNSTNSGTTRFVNFQESDGGAVGGVRTDSGNVQLYNTSDKRLKKNIRPNEWNGLDIINKSKLYDFEWIKSGETHRGGWIAQEMLDVWEDVVVKPDEQDEHYHIATSYFVPMLVKAVQELSEKNDALEKRIEELEK
jgi:hypothetical protein